MTNLFPQDLVLREQDRTEAQPGYVSVLANRSTKDPSPAHKSDSPYARRNDPTRVLCGPVGRPQARPEDGQAPAVGDTVEVPSASWTSTIPSPERNGVWTGPGPDEAVRAIHCARVIEIPTPRWTAYDDERFGTTIQKEVPMTTTRRACTSPIWSAPGR